MMDGRLKGTKCEGCSKGRYLILDDIRYTDCADCIDRPNRKKDKSRFAPDYESEDIRRILDEDAKKGAKTNF